MVPEFYSSLLPVLENAPAPSLAYSLAEAIDGNSGRLRDIGAAPFAASRRIAPSEFIGRQRDLQTVYCGSIVVKTGGRALRTRFPTEFPQVGDCVFYAELAAECRELFEVGKRLTQIRLHTTSATSRNARNLDAFVHDEWRAMCRIAPLLGHRGLARLLHSERSKLLFAARTVVKWQLFAGSNPDHAAETKRIGVRIVGRFRWELARVAVWIRDRVSGRPSY